MTTYLFKTVEYFGDISFDVTGVGVTIFAEADLTVSSDLHVRSFNLNSQFDLVDGIGQVFAADADLFVDSSIVATNVFEGDIVEPQTFTATTAMDVSGTRILEGVASLVNNPLRSENTLIVNDEGIIYSYTVAFDTSFAIDARPFTNFVDADATLTVNSFNLTSSIVVEDADQNTLTATATLFVFDEFIDGTTRKFTNNQLSAIVSNRARVVDWIEIYPNFQDPTLPNATTQDILDVLANTAVASDFQWPMQPVYRFNSGARDLDMVDYTGNTFNYKGKNVMFTLPSFNYDSVFNKKTMKVSLNGLLLHFQYAAALERLNGARIVLGKAVFASSNTTNGVSSAVSGERLNMDMNQVDGAVLLMRGIINNVIIAGNSTNNELVLEISHGFYDFDKNNGVQPNTANYQDYLEKTGFNDPTVSTSRMGATVKDNVLWGLTRA